MHSVISNISQSELKMCQDLISSLMTRGSYNHLIIHILIQLDEESLTNTAAVCRLWYSFMLRNIKYNQQFLSRRLDLHFREKIPEVRNISGYIFSYSLNMYNIVGRFTYCQPIR